MIEPKIFIDKDGTELSSLSDQASKINEHQYYNDIHNAFNRKRHTMPKKDFIRLIKALEEHIAFGMPIAAVALAHNIPSSLIYTLKYLYNPFENE
jgi:hypothetical protein